MPDTTARSGKTETIRLVGILFEADYRGQTVRRHSRLKSPLVEVLDNFEMDGEEVTVKIDGAILWEGTATVYFMGLRYGSVPVISDVFRVNKKDVNLSRWYDVECELRIDIERGTEK